MWWWTHKICRSWLVCYNIEFMKSVRVPGKKDAKKWLYCKNKDNEANKNIAYQIQSLCCCCCCSFFIFQLAMRFFLLFLFACENTFHNIIVKFNMVIKEFRLICIDFGGKFKRADENSVHASQTDTDLLMNRRHLWSLSRLSFSVRSFARSLLALVSFFESVFTANAVDYV